MHKFIWSNKDHQVNLHDPLLEGGDRDQGQRQHSRNKSASIYEQNQVSFNQQAVIKPQQAVVKPEERLTFNSRNSAQKHKEANSSIQSPSNASYMTALTPMAERLKPENKFSFQLNYLIRMQRKNKDVDGKFYLDCEYDEKGKLDPIQFAPTSTFMGLTNTSQLRYNIAWFVTRQLFINFILVVILFNSILMGCKDYLDKEDTGSRNQKIEQFDPIINPIIYSECILKIIAMGFVNGEGSYLRDGWNVLDFVVVSASAATDIIGHFQTEHNENSGMQALRTFRLLRPLRLLGRVKSLKTLVSTLLDSMQALSATLGLACFVYTVYAIFGITIWQGALHHRCYRTESPYQLDNGKYAWDTEGSFTAICSDNYPCGQEELDNGTIIQTYCGSRYEAKKEDGSLYDWNNPDLNVDTKIEELFWGINNYDNLGSAMITIFQVTTLDGWTPIMNFYEEADSRVISWFFYITLVILCNFFILNLTIGQMMLKYDDTRHAQREEDYKQDPPIYDEFDSQLLKMGEQILPKQYCIGDKECNLLKWLIENDDGIKISKEARAIVMRDQNFFRNFAEAQKQDDLDLNHPYYDNSVVELCLKVVESTSFNSFVIIVIILNTIVLAFDKYPDYEEETGIPLLFRYLNILFTLVFTLDLVFKVIGLGVGPFFNDGFNIFDLVIVVTSIYQIVLEESGVSEKQGGFMLVLRAFRCFRVFKLFKVGDLRVLMDSQVTTMPQMLPFMLLLLFFFYIFSLIGMSFFAGKVIFDSNDKPVFVDEIENLKYHSQRAPDYAYSIGTPYIVDANGNNVTIGTPVREGFDRLGQSMLTIFQVLMGAEWRFIWYQIMRTCGKGAAVFFVALIVCIVIVMINLLMAIMLGNYDKARVFSDKKQVLEAFRVLQEEKQDFNSVFDEKINSPYFKKYVPNYHNSIHRKPKYTFERILEIIFKHEPKFLHEIKYKILKLEDQKMKDLKKMKELKKKSSFAFNRYKQQKENSSFKYVKIDSNFWEQKEQDRLLLLEAQDIDHDHTEACRNADISPYANSSMGIFHIDGTIRKACLALACELGIYNEIIHTRKRILDRDPKSQVERYKQCMREGKEWGPLVPPELTDDERIKGTNWNSCFENFILLLIIANSLLLVFDSPLRDPEGQFHKTMSLINQIFTVLFTFELIVRVIAHGLFSNQLFHVDPYLTSGWNWLDLIIVISSLIDLITQLLQIKSNNLGAIKALRSLRALRPLRVIKSQPKLKQVVNAFFSAIIAIKNILFIGALLILIFSIIGVSLFKGLYYQCSNDSDNSIITKEDCLSDADNSWDQNDSNFDNVIQAFRTLFVLTTTEGWAGMMYYGVDTVGVDMQIKQDASPNMVIFFILFMIVGALFVMNMFVGVVVDTFNTQKSIQRNAETDNSEINLKTFLVMKEIDIIKKSMVKNVEEPKNWRQPFYKMVHNKRFDNFILIIVILNTLTMSMQRYNAPATYHAILSTCNFSFTIIFNLEMIFKLIADKLNYFKHKWNLFDMFIVISGDIGLIMAIGSTQQHQKNTMTIFRILRILRVVRLLQRFENIQVLLDALVMITPNILHVVMLLGLVMYVYALVGIYMFSKTLQREELDFKNNFSSMGRSLLVLTRYATGEDFQEFMYEHSNTGSPCPANPNFDKSITDKTDKNFFEYILPTADDANGCDCLPIQSWRAWDALGNLECGSIYAIPFFLSYQVIAGWLILNLIIAAIIDGLSMAQKGREEAIKKENLDEYLKLWQKFDPDLKWKINFDDVWLFMAELKYPFNESRLLRNWDQEKEGEKDPGRYYYSREFDNEGNENELKYKVKKFDCLQTLKDSNSKFKVQTKDYTVESGTKYVQRSQLFVEFKDLTHMIVKKVFILEAAGDDAPYNPQEAKIDKSEKLKNRIQKAKTMSKITQQILSERGVHYAHDDPVNQLAAVIIQNAARQKFDFDNLGYLKTDASKNSMRNLSLQQSKFQGNIKAPQPKFTNKQGTGKDGIKTKMVKRGNTVEMKRNQFNQNDQ